MKKLFASFGLAFTLTLITQGTLANSNYDISFVGANFSVTAQPVSVAELANDITKTAEPKVATSFSMASLAVSPAARVSSPGVKVELVQRPELQEAGLVTVSVPSDLAMKASGLAFALPNELLGLISNAVGIEAALGNGAPLPSWLNFDGSNGQFVVSGVGDATFPIEISVQIGAKQVKIVVSEQKI